MNGGGDYDAIGGVVQFIITAGIAVFLFMIIFGKLFVDLKI